MNYLITGWDLRKVYAETSALSLDAFVGGAGKYYEVEGILRDHEFYAGGYWDGYILSFWCDEWQNHLKRLLPLVLGDTSTR